MTHAPKRPRTVLAIEPGAALPVARYRFVFRMQDEIRLPEYSGSLLRGQFGAALRRTACMTGLRNCSPCPLYRTCPYPAIFETPPPAKHSLQRFSQVPNPYIIEPPALGLRDIPVGEKLSFCLVLVGRALDQLPLIAYAMQHAFARGVGRTRARGELEDIVLECHESASSVWGPESMRLEPHEPALTIPDFPDTEAIALQIETPLRLQNQGHPIACDALRPRTLFTALMRRTALLLEFHATSEGLAGNATHLAAVADRLDDERCLQWKDWKRFSSRQQQEMTLGGVVGQWKLRGDLTELLPWFWLGQWLHVGKNATMGLGRYSLADAGP
jgi:CRISPR-associated endoribonuclease Cas6